MRRLAGLSLLAGLVFATAARPATGPLPDPAAALQRYSTDPDAPAPCAAALRQLSAPRAEDRRKAAAYLVELVTLALADERSREAPWQATPFFGAGPESPARNLRGQIAWELTKIRLH